MRVSKIGAIWRSRFVSKIIAFPNAIETELRDVAYGIVPFIWEEFIIPILNHAFWCRLVRFLFSESSLIRIKCGAEDRSRIHDLMITKHLLRHSGPICLCNNKLCRSSKQRLSDRFQDFAPACYDAFLLKITTPTR
jgi:hypothetical protein